MCPCVSVCVIVLLHSTKRYYRLDATDLGTPWTSVPLCTRAMSVYVNACHWISSYVTMCHCISLYGMICHCVWGLFIVRHGMLLYCIVCHCMALRGGECHFMPLYGPLARYVILQVANAPGMSGSFFPPSQVSNPDMHYVPWCMPESLINGFLWSRRRGKRSRHSRCMRNPQCYVSGKRPMSLSMSLCVIVVTGEAGA